MINLLKIAGILVLLLPWICQAQSSQVEIDPSANETIKIDSERAITVTLGRSHLNELTFNGNKIFTDENSIGAGYQHFLNNRVSVDASMNFAFNSRGEQSYYSGTVLGTFHRPLYKDELNLRAAMGLSYSQFQFSALRNSVRDLAGKNQVSWLEGVVSLGLEYKLFPDLSLIASTQYRQAGLAEVSNNSVEGSSFIIQPLGLNFYY